MTPKPAYDPRAAGCAGLCAAGGHGRGAALAGRQPPARAADGQAGSSDALVALVASALLWQGGTRFTDYLARFPAVIAEQISGWHVQRLCGQPSSSRRNTTRSGLTTA